MTTRRGRLLRWFVALLLAVPATLAIGAAVIWGSGDGQSAIAAFLMGFHAFGVLGCLTCWWLTGWRSWGWPLVIVVLVVLAFTPLALFAALIAPFWWAAGILVAIQPPKGSAGDVT